MSVGVHKRGDLSGLDSNKPGRREEILGKKNKNKKNRDQRGQKEEIDFWAFQDMGSVSVSTVNEGRIKD